MTETSEHPSPAELRNLSTLREMSTDDLMALSQQLLVCEEPKGAVLLQHGATEDNTLYLLEGSCRLVAEDGKIKLVKHTDPSAHAPLARLRPSHYRVVAESKVRFLRIDNALLEEARSDMQQSSGLSLGAYEVEEEDDLAQMGAENRLTLQIYEDLNCGKLLLPSLPHVAIRIGEAVQDEHSDARRVAEREAPDEQRHREADAAEDRDAGQLAPAHAARQVREAELHGDPRRERDARRRPGVPGAGAGPTGRSTYGRVR